MKKTKIHIEQPQMGLPYVDKALCGTISKRTVIHDFAEEAHRVGLELDWQFCEVCRERFKGWIADLEVSDG